MCRGHNTAMEIYKIVAQLFQQFDFEIVDPVEPWKGSNKVAMVQRDFFVRVSERNDRSSPVGLAKSR